MAPGVATHGLIDHGPIAGVLGCTLEHGLTKLPDKGVLLPFCDQHRQVSPRRVGLWPFLQQGHAALALGGSLRSNSLIGVRENVLVLSSCKSSREPRARMSR